MTARRWGAACAAVLLAGCGPPQPATVLGDAYLVEGLGREVNLAGLKVRLIPEDEELDSALARYCPTRHVPHPAPLELHQRAWAGRAGLLRPRVVDSAVADPRASFAFPRVEPGAYRLWADTTVGKVRWTWLHPVVLRPGDTVRLELNNANPDENPFRCGPRG